jgi:catechol 2,3-dioxygenase-like lactoylglutathione lyase family enzyme
VTQPIPESASPAPAIRGVVETCLYVADLDASRAFYEGVLGLRLHDAGERLVSLMVAPRQMLLLFRRQGSLKPIPTAGGTIPPVDGAGPTHLGLSIDADQLDAWRFRLQAAHVAIESEVTWPRGGHSLYFRDPDGNLVELLTPGVWPVY